MLTDLKCCTIWPCRNEQVRLHREYRESNKPSSSQYCQYLFRNRENVCVKEKEKKNVQCPVLFYARGKLSPRISRFVGMTMRRSLRSLDFLRSLCPIALLGSPTSARLFGHRRTAEEHGATSLSQFAALLFSSCSSEVTFLDFLS